MARLWEMSEGKRNDILVKWLWNAAAVAGVLGTEILFGGLFDAIRFVIAAIFIGALFFVLGGILWVLGDWVIRKLRRAD